MDEATIKGLPRTFVEVFELVANEEGTGNENPQPGVSLIPCDIYVCVSKDRSDELLPMLQYHILRDTFRFVG